MASITKYWFAILMICIVSITVKGSQIVLDKELVIHIKAQSNVSTQRFNIDIKKKSNKVKIVYSVFDSTRILDLNNDTLYKRMRDQLYKGIGIRIKDTAVIKKLNNISEQYSVYSRDSMLVNLATDTSYAHLLALVAASSKQQLENNAYNKTRIVIDGVDIDYIISNSSGIKSVRAHSPNKISHPLLYQLLTKTFSLYRQSHNNNFLLSSKTSGY